MTAARYRAAIAEWRALAAAAGPDALCDDASPHVVAGRALRSEALGALCALADALDAAEAELASACTAERCWRAHYDHCQRRSFERGYMVGRQKEREAIAGVLESPIASAVWMVPAVAVWDRRLPEEDRKAAAQPLAKLIRYGQLTEPVHPVERPFGAPGAADCPCTACETKRRGGQP